MASPYVRFPFPPLDFKTYQSRVDRAHDFWRSAAEAKNLDSQEKRTKNPKPRASNIDGEIVDVHGEA